MSIPNMPVNSRGNVYVAQLESKPDHEQKNNDVLIFSRLGTTTIKNNEGGFLKGGLFKASSSGFFKNLFKHKATKADVVAIFKTAGMSEAKANLALQRVKEASKNHGISGLSANSVRSQVEEFTAKKKLTSI
jgi:hypothetical protein